MFLEKLWRSERHLVQSNVGGHYGQRNVALVVLVVFAVLGVIRALIGA